MGYFSNGTEGMAYEEHYCSRCQHLPENPNDGGCAVWLAHILHNYEECNKKESILHILIPRTKDGLCNAQCTMFIARPGEEDRNQTKLWPKATTEGGR